MLSFPTSTLFERRIPKQKFYQNLDVTAEVKRLFIEQIKLITWANKLSAQTMNLAPGQTVQEIEVFRIRMAGDVLDSRVLNLMDKQIPYHLLFVLERSDGKCQLSVTYKEASQSGGSAFQLRQNYRTVWQTPEALTLNLRALSLPKSRREKKQRKQKILQKQMPSVMNCLQKELSSKTPAKVWYGIMRSKERWKKESILI